MAGAPSSVKVKRASWSRALAGLLRGMAGDAALLAWWGRMVDSGDMSAVGVYEGRRLVGAFLLREERGFRGAELVVMAAAGDLKGADLVATVLPAVEELARRSGVARVRFETSRHGLVRKTALLGYEFASVVMVKELGA